MGYESILFLAVVVFIIFIIRRSRRATQLAFIENYRFNSTIGKKLKAHYTHLTDDDQQLVMSALRDYFYVCHKAKRRTVAMPSQVVDVAWHEFILFTRAYQEFCKNALGRFLHHTPTEAMSTPTIAQDGIKRAWRITCDKEGINPASPEKLPLLFEIDSRLKIEDGFTYALDCRDKRSPNYGSGYCAGHIGCASGCSGDSGSPSSSGGLFDSGDSSGCGGGCGGD